MRTKTEIPVKRMKVTYVLFLCYFKSYQVLQGLEPRNSLNDEKILMKPQFLNSKSNQEPFSLTIKLKSMTLDKIKHAYFFQDEG